MASKEEEALDSYLASEDSSYSDAANPIIDYGGRVLDYPSGIVRTAAFSALSPFLRRTDQSSDSQTPVVTREDLLAALKGKATPSSEYLKRVGAPETAADISGFVLDAAADPSTYLTGGESKLAQGLRLFLAPGRNAMQATGKSIYKAGLKNVDEAVKRYPGKKMPSEVMWEKDLWGSANGLREDASRLASGLENKKQEIYAASDAAGARSSMGDALQDANKKLAEVDSPFMQANRETEFLGKLIEGYHESGDQLASQYSKWKTEIYAALGSRAYLPETVLTPYEKVLKKLAKGFEAAADQATVNAGFGHAARDLNKEMAPILTARKAFNREAAKETVRNVVTPVDAMLGMGAKVAGAGTKGTIEMLAAKKAADVAKTVGARTGLGIALKNVANSRLPYGMAKRGVVNVVKSHKPSKEDESAMDAYLNEGK